ncbi:MAG: SpoIIE family protein phosphatase [Coriobacteriales bacterium]|nr:SpoIIE family protein phosphatase [Coriobacteriales bacterium]
MDRTPRLMIAVVLAVACISLTFTQLGFLAVTLPGGTVGYVVVLLGVVALGALLLGTFFGTALGLLAGGVLLLHAHYLPLDHYELSFVTPVTSIVMLGFAGLLLGVLFAFVLRNKPSRGRFTVYITIVCIIVAALYSLAFVSNVYSLLVMSLAESINEGVDEAYVRELAASTALRLGNIGVQIILTAAFMALLCFVGNYLAQKRLEHSSSLGLRALFGLRLSVVVLLTFMMMTAVSYVVVTWDELWDNAEQMRDEVTYLCNQLEDNSKRSKAFADFTERSGFDYNDYTYELWYDTVRILSDDNLLSGYSVEEDGDVIVLVGSLIDKSNNSRYSDLYFSADYFSSGMREAIEKSIDTGKMQRFVYDEVKLYLENPNLNTAEMTQPYVAYLLAKRMGFENYEGDKFTQTVIIIRSSSMVFEKRAFIMTWEILGFLVLLLAVFFIVFQLISKVIASYIDETNGVLARITSGDLDARVEVHDTREFDSLSNGINTTVDALKGWIAEAETRMDAELATARAIQEATLPRDFPPFPDICRFDIFASMEPAREVGGDFYDFFLIGEDCDSLKGKVGFVVADVSGKGIPAALFMMKAKALIRDYVDNGVELGEAVSAANKQLCDGNNEAMFVTAWIGVLDYATGHVDYVNAGHNPPLLWQREGGWRWLKQRSGPMLGLYDISYRTYSVDCIAGDTFLLYTDGVTEAFDVNEKLYGEDRLLVVAEKGYRLHPEDLLESVRADVAAYTEEAEQSDDITILALEVGVPPELTKIERPPIKIKGNRG